MSKDKIQTANFSTQPSETAQTMGDISIQNITLSDLKTKRVTIQPGGSWSKDIKPSTGTDSCQNTHVGYMVSGTLAVRMDHGQEEHFTEGSVFVVPPGHDAWCVGNEAAVSVEFRGGGDGLGK